MGCSDEEVVPATQLTVSVNSDIAELRSLEIDVRSADGEDSSDMATVELSSGAAEDDRLALPFSFGIERRGADQLRIRIRGYDADDALLVEQQALVSFRAGETRLLRIFLPNGCVALACSAEETCRDTNRELGGSGASLSRASCYPIMERNDLATIAPGDELDTWMPRPVMLQDGGRTGPTGRLDGGVTGPISDPDANVPGRDGGNVQDAGGPDGGDGQPAPDAGQDGGATDAGGDPCDACQPNETCEAGRCVCPQGTTRYYADRDDDGFGDPGDARDVCGDAPDGFVLLAGDCCDRDDLAYPGQTVPQAEPMACDRGDLSFDYDCDGVPIGWVAFAGGVCCDLTIGWQNGWTTYVPECGESASFTECNTASCIPETYQTTQVCL